MLTMTIRAPTNAKSFSARMYFFSAEYPEWVCSEYNDFFVALVDSVADGNPADKNVAVYDDGMTKWPIGVNLTLVADVSQVGQPIVGRLGLPGSDDDVAVPEVSERESVREIVRKMLPLYRTQLRGIAVEPDLSLRLLNILVREGAISAQDIRREAGRLDAILSRMSMMNAIRLAKSRVVRRADLDEQERTRLAPPPQPGDN